MLFTVILLPMVGATITWLFCRRPVEIFFVGLLTTLLTFFETLYLYHCFDWNTGEFQFVFNGILGADGISMVMVLLTSFLMCITLLSTWKAIQVQLKTLVILLLLIESLIFGVFLSTDLLLFYICFEATLIPLFFLVGIYGSRDRKVQAAYELFLYTFLGSLVMLVGVLAIYFEFGTLQYQYLLSVPISEERQYWLWLAFFLSFAIKVPMVPFHIWLPEAHVEAPTAGSVLLAGIILKLGGYGFVRYSLALFPEASIAFRPFVFTLALIGILYASIACLAQTDIKKVIAYSSVAHMNTSLLGLFSGSLSGIAGSIFFMVSHGLVSSALFLLVGVLYDRYHTRTVLYYRGLVLVMPLFAVFFLFFTMANIAFPGTSSFIAELMSFLGSMNTNPVLTLLATTAIILGPCYALWYYHQISYGSISPYLPHLFMDISLKEFHLFVPLILFTIMFGLMPNLVLNIITLPCLHLISI
jgi:proton-translocating NADH-quinone oxidoreductase chain M